MLKFKSEDFYPELIDKKDDCAELVPQFVERANSILEKWLAEAQVVYCCTDKSYDKKLSERTVWTGQGFKPDTHRALLVCVEKIEEDSNYFSCEGCGVTTGKDVSGYPSSNGWTTKYTRLGVRYFCQLCTPPEIKSKPIGETMKYLLIITLLVSACASQPKLTTTDSTAVKPPVNPGLVNIYGPKCPRAKDPVLAAQELLATRTPDGEIVIEKGVDPKRVIRAIIESVARDPSGAYDSCKVPVKKK